ADRAHEGRASDPPTLRRAHVLVAVLAAGQLARSGAGRRGVHHEMPTAGGPVAVDVDLRARQHRVGETLRYLLVTGTDRVTTRAHPEGAAVPDSVLGEHLCDRVGLVRGHPAETPVTCLEVPDLQLLDLLDVLESPDARVERLRRARRIWCIGHPRERRGSVAQAASSTRDSLGPATPGPTSRTGSTTPGSTGGTATSRRRNASTMRRTSIPIREGPTRAPAAVSRGRATSSVSHVGNAERPTSMESN